MAQQTSYDTSVIKEILPQRTPFLFVDRVIELKTGEMILTEKDLLPEDIFFPGHFPGRPLMPGVLVSEALAQTSGLLLGLSALEKKQQEGNQKPNFFLASVNMKYLTPAEPGDTLRLKATLVKGFAGLYMFDVAAYAHETRIAKGTLTLAEEKK